MRANRHFVTRFLRGAMLAGFLAACTVPAAMAEELKDGLVIYKHDGSKVSYFLEHTPVVTFVGDKLHLESSEVSADHNLADVDRFTFEKVSVGIESIVAGDCRISVAGNIVTLQGFAPATKASVADMQGRIVASATVDAQGQATIDLNDVTTGVYVVATTDGKTFKLIKK